MKRVISRVGLAALVAASIGVVGGGNVAHAVTDCPPSIFVATVTSSVNVPAGQSCTISNSTVTGNVIVQPGGSLFIQGSTINGNVTATSPSSIRIGGLNCTSASCTRTSIIKGSVSVTGTTNSPEGPNYICEATKINGSLTVNGSGPNAPWLIGYTQLVMVGPCALTVGNTINGSVTLNTNQARVQFDDNTVGGAVTARNNTGSNSEVRENSIGTGLTVINNNPCWFVNDNTVGGTQNVQTCA